MHALIQIDARKLIHNVTFIIEESATRLVQKYNVHGSVYKYTTRILFPSHVITWRLFSFHLGDYLISEPNLLSENNYNYDIVP